MKLVCDTCCMAKLTEEELPKALVVFSDMQFDQASDEVAGDSTDSCMVKIERMWQNCGYDSCPKIIFWNLAATSSFPSSSRTKNVQMLSGFSQNLINSFLKDDDLDTSPETALRNILDEEWLDEVRNIFNPTSNRMNDPALISDRKRVQKALAALKRSDNERKISVAKEDHAAATAKNHVIPEQLQI
jgi:hypothetical protein